MRRACSLAVFRRRLSSKPTATPAVATSSEAVTPATSDSNNEVETKTMLLKDAPTIRPPYYRKAHSYHEAKHMLQEEFPNEGDLTGAGARLYAYKRTGEIAASLINIAERIDFVSPYERPWTRFEKTWRREWHPALIATRKAWALPAIPAYYDVLDFYKYITKTRVDEQLLSDLYSGIVLPMQTYMDLAKESLRSHFTSTRFDSEAERVSACLSSLMDDAILCLAHNKPELADYRVAYEAQSESFWVRAGFEFLYDNQDLGSDEVTQKLWNNQKYIGDDRRKLGQLAFVHRDRLAAMARSRKGMRDMLHKRDSDESTASVFPTAEDEQRVMYSPKVFNLWPDDQPLWQTPGYFVESDETHQHTVFATKSLSGLRERIGKHWGMQGEEAEEAFAECAKAQAVASTFANLAATAHVQGFTQYNDVNRSYNTQLMLSDGREYMFAVGQLNTLAINVNIPGFSNPLSNAIRIEGPFKLFDSIEEGKFVTNGEEGLNKAVLERILQMIFKSTQYQK